ncbi:MAG: transglycosylase domain-containing protein [Akkermansiaceae bacterium]
MSTWRPITEARFWMRWLPACLHTPLLMLFWASLCLLVVGLGVMFYYYLEASKFDLDEVGKLPKENTYYDRSGKLIDVPDDRAGKNVKRSDIPEDLVHALIAREDARFFEHGGVDVRGLGRATLRNIKDRNFTQGASTLTMQLARNTFEMRAKSLNRKAVEIALSMRIEGSYSKDEILTNYLNRIYFGSGAYGIEQAAQTYFGKTTSELHAGECAMIAGIIRGPHIYSPLRNFEKAINQRDQTLARMVDAQIITQVRADEIKAMKIGLNEKSKQNGAQRSYALLAMKEELESLMERENILLNGLKIYSTIDIGWQTRLESELNLAVSGLEKEKGWQHHIHSKHEQGMSVDYVQYAAVSTETKSGEILAYIGGRDYTHSTYDRTNAKRDLGSAFEPFVAAAAAERGKLVLAGKPIQTGRQIGPQEVQRLALRCGISGPFVDNEDLYRGVVSATPMEMSVGLATLGNKGNKPKPHLIRKITDNDGNVLYHAKPKTQPALSKSAAEDAVGVLKNTSGTRSFTGATGSERDAWVMRLGPSGSTTIWIGFDTPKKIAPEARLNALLDEFVRRLGI